MKICIDARPAMWSRGTGIGTYTYQLIKNLYVDKSNTYIGIAPEGSDEYYEDIDIEKTYIGVEKHSIEEDIKLKEILNDIKPDIYHVPQNGIGMPTKKIGKYVATIHDIIPYRMPEAVSASYMTLFSQNVPQILNKSDLILTVSEYSKKDICELFGISSEKVCVTYLAPEDMYKIINKKEAKRVMSEKYSTPPNYILYVGGYGKRKNIELIINAYERVYKKLSKDIYLVIAGDKNYKADSIIRLVERLGIADKVFLIGKVAQDDMPFLYNAASLFVYPSFYEGFGLPPLEAMACGIPVITANVTSIPEVVGDAAIKVNPYDTDELAERMYHILEDEYYYAIMKEKAICHVKNYTWEKTVRRTIEAYNNLQNQ